MLQHDPLVELPPAVFLINIAAQALRVFQIS